MTGCPVATRTDACRSASAATSSLPQHASRSSNCTTTSIPSPTGMSGTAFVVRSAQVAVFRHLRRRGRRQASGGYRHEVALHGAVIAGRACVLTSRARALQAVVIAVTRASPHGLRRLAKTYFADAAAYPDLGGRGRRGALLPQLPCPAAHLNAASVYEPGANMSSEIPTTLQSCSNTAWRGRPKCRPAQQGNYSGQRSSGRQKPSLGVFHSSVGRNMVPGVRRFASIASRLMSMPRPGLSGTVT